jgi:hypothetical protein
VRVASLLLLLVSGAVAQTPWTVAELSPESEISYGQARDAVRAQPDGPGTARWLEAVARARPERTRLLRVGKTSVLELGARGLRARAARPVVIVTPGLAGAQEQETRACLAALDALLIALDRDDPRLTDTTWLVMPAPDREGEVNPGHDFPVGWDPRAPVSTGPWPMSSSAARVLANLMIDGPRVACLWTPGGAGPVAGGAGSYGRALGLGLVEDADAQAWTKAWGALPAVSVTATSVQPLGGELWRAEVVVGARGDGVPGRVRLELGGARLIACRREGRTLNRPEFDLARGGEARVVLVFEANPRELPRVELRTERGRVPGEPELLR